MNNKPIEKGSIVKYNDEWMRVTVKFKRHVNLGGIFGSKTTIKNVPLAGLVEDYDGWSERYSKSDSYKCN